MKRQVKADLRLRRITGIVTGFIALGAVGLMPLGCDPCSGIAQCAAEGNPYLAVDGQIVEAVSGDGVDGVRVTLVRRGGISVMQDSVSTVTADGGHWRVRFSTVTAGALDAEAIVATPEGVTYTVRGLHFSSSNRGGEANLVERWVSNLYFPNLGEIYTRGTADDRVAGARIEFRRTGGVPLMGPGVKDGVYTSTTDFAGRVRLFTVNGAGVFTNALGDVIGDLIIHLSATDSSIVRGLHVAASHVFRPTPSILRLGAGASLDFPFELYNRVNGARFAGVQVDFQRTGGVALTVPAFTMVSSTSGRIAFTSVPLAEGAVEGRLIFRAPSPARPETLFVSLPLVDENGVDVFRGIGLGAYLPYYGIVVLGGIGVDGVEVDVARVSGVGISPATFTTRTGSGGIFGMPAAPVALGDLVVDVTFRPPGFTPYTVRGVKISALDRSVPARLIGVFRVDAPPPVSPMPTPAVP